MAEAIEEAGAQLAARHLSAVPVDEDESLLRYAERSRVGGWSLRAGLVRLAQPEPGLAAEVLESVRRCDRALAASARAMTSHGVITDRDLEVSPDGLLSQVSEPVADARAADLARLAVLDREAFPARLEAYRRAVRLDEDELAALPLLAVALTLDEVGDVVALWASRRGAESVEGGGDPGIEVVRRLAARASAELDAMGVPREERERSGRG